MNTWFVRALPVVCTVLMLIGCGDSQAPEQQKKIDAAEQTIAELRTQLTQADQERSRCRQENKELQSKAESLALQLRKTQEQSAAGSTRESGGEGIPGEQRVGLLGAKALAEHQAEQLKRRVEALSKNLEAKETELKSIRQTAAQKDSEMAGLKQNLEQLQASEQKRTAELTARLDNLSKELEKRGAEGQALKKDLAERSEILATLKNAITDSAKLKSQAEADASRLKTDLTEAMNQLQFARTTGSQQVQAIERLETSATEAQEELAECRHAAQQLKSATDRLQKETRDLRAKVDQLSAQVRAEDTEEETPSVIDRILR
jgi:chromosome segregation ATPase